MEPVEETVTAEPVAKRFVVTGSKNEYFHQSYDTAEQALLAASVLMEKGFGGHPVGSGFLVSLAERINSDFTYHPPKSQDEVEWYQTIRNQAKALALLIDTVVPDGREKSTAITKLEEAVFWANAGIARASSADA